MPDQMEVDGHPLAPVNEISIVCEAAEAASSRDGSDSSSDPAVAQGEEGQGVATVDSQMEANPSREDNQAPESGPDAAHATCSSLPHVSEGTASGSGQITGAPVAATAQRLEVAKESWDLLETAQVLSEIAAPLLPKSSPLEADRQVEPFAEVSDPHVLVLSTVQQEHTELQVPEEVILELPNGIKMYGKDLAGITELLHPTQVLLQTGPRKFTLATADALLSAGSLVFAVSQETSQEEPLVKQPDPEVEGKLYRCYLCSLTFNRRGNYVRHKKIHMVNTEDDTRYKCPQCDRQFIQHCDLRRHAHVHTGTQPHKCDLCGKAFLRASDLVVHKRFHTKDRPFQCSQCQKSFFQSGDLRRHMRNIHMTNARMLSCGHCKKKYTKEATLLHHIQTVHQDILLQTLKEQGQHSSEIMVSEAGSVAEEERSLSTYRLEHTGTGSIIPAPLIDPAACEETALEKAHGSQYSELHPSVSGQHLETTIPDSTREQTQALLGCSGSGPSLVLIDMHPTATTQERPHHPDCPTVK
ncbi:zinc finger protein 546-like [Pristis pectinata]|uniref:zinc finger protein 546-like n=1 Tax=Pristis pectinata TaxID=685728 RepID=UPI00223DB3C8|nr:zinc finger protein 546-like [Pristis pectinata]XP_051882819.1 zinc finger protein 546-like [Pristis pectinata]